MSLRNRLLAIAVMAAAAVLAIILSQTGMPVIEQPEEEVPAEAAGDKDTVLIWYTDEGLTDYISSAAVAFNQQEENQKLRVIPVLVSGLEYLENINRESVAGKPPDLYVIGHDSLEKAYLAGLAAEIKLPGDSGFDTLFPEVGRNAVTYHDKILGYPLYFETSALLYNRTYLEDMARTQLEAEADETAALEAQQELAENGPAEESEETQAEAAATHQEAVEHLLEDGLVVENRVADLLPRTMNDMKVFGDNYDAPEQVEAVFKWDVTDIFYNYFFVGNTMVVGGESGDNTEAIDIYNQDAISSMRMYQNLNQFFAIDTNEVEYSALLEDFIAGKLVFTVATTDAVARLDQAAGEGTFAYEYGLLHTPDIDENIPARTLSMTNCVVVNGYSEYQEEANRFADFLTGQYVENLYARSGKAAAALGIDYGNGNLDKFAAEYARSIPLPKMIETSNFWVQLEIVFARIWDGANANQELKRLSEQIMAQITGEPYTEEEIVETEEETEVEYLDEDALRQEALSE